MEILWSYIFYLSNIYDAMKESTHLSDPFVLALLYSLEMYSQQRPQDFFIFQPKVVAKQRKGKMGFPRFILIFFLFF